MMTEYDFMSLVMYPNLKNRREFIHQCWVIAKGTDNLEFKIAVSNDRYFYITREDLLVLLRTKDKKMISHVLSNKCRLQIRDDIGYKLVQIKGTQVDKNQQTPVHLIDFISVLVENKRDNKFDSKSKIIFSNSFILEFIKDNQEFVKDDQIMSIFIMARRFRLSLKWLQITGLDFKIDFFIKAI